MSAFKSLMLAPALLALWACTPAFNWREVRIEGTGLRALLPCKPEHASRRQSLAGHASEMQMVGCETSGVLFALSHVALADVGQVSEAQSQWQVAMLKNMQAGTPQVQPWLIKAGDKSSVVQKLLAQGQRADGSRVTATAVWFSRGVHVYHAVIYADAVVPEVTETFFSGIELQ